LLDAAIAGLESQRHTLKAASSFSGEAASSGWKLRGQPETKLISQLHLD